MRKKHEQTTRTLLDVIPHTLLTNVGPSTVFVEEENDICHLFLSSSFVTNTQRNKNPLDMKSKTWIMYLGEYTRTSCCFMI